MIRSVARAATTALAMALATGAGAQERQYFPRDRSISVTERPHPELDPLGLPVGSFLIYPSATAGIAYDDNIYALPDHGPSDEIVTLAADLAVKSIWSRHALALHADVTRNQYLRAGDQSTTDYDIGADGRLDLGDGYVSLLAETARLTQSRTDVDAPGASAAPIRYQRSNVAAEAQQTFGRFHVQGGAEWRRYRFDDAFTLAGERLAQGFRNRDVTTERLRVDYAVSPALALYVDGSINQRSYAIRPLFGPPRDSHGYTIEGGADFDITKLVRGHVQLGYLAQDSRSGLWRAHGLSGRGRIEWFATPLITVTLEGARTIEDTAEVDTPAYSKTSLELKADYELLRSLIVSASGGIEWDRFQATGQRAERTRASLAARYRIGRAIVVDAAYQHLSQGVSGAPGLSRFADNRVLLTLRFQK
jgi:hypothetical protein